MLIEETNSHLLHSIQRQNQQLVLLLTRWSWWTPTVHFKCFTRITKAGGCVRLKMIWEEKKTSLLNGFGATKLILVDPLHIEPPFQSAEPPRLFCSNEKVKGRLLQTEIKKKCCEKEKRGLEAFSYHLGFSSALFLGRVDVWKANWSFFCFKVRYLSTMNIKARATVDWVYCGKALCPRMNQIHYSQCFVFSYECRVSFTRLCLFRIIII